MYILNSNFERSWSPERPGFRCRQRGCCCLACPAEYCAPIPRCPCLGSKFRSLPRTMYASEHRGYITRTTTHTYLGTQKRRARLATYLKRGRCLGMWDGRPEHASPYRLFGSRPNIETSGRSLVQPVFLHLFENPLDKIAGNFTWLAVLRTLSALDAPMNLVADTFLPPAKPDIASFVVVPVSSQPGRAMQVGGCTYASFCTSKLFARVPVPDVRH
ncbi:hypothetical protein LX36DRAFT_112116 [Colletotrichum falcatum]|nr:hypothetical protein LX36DRAFT_112116 [Colletotrichum falcatum]